MNQKLQELMQQYAFEGTITPIKDGYKVVGAVTYCFQQKRKSRLYTSQSSLQMPFIV